MTMLKVTTIDNQPAVILPPEVLSRLNAAVGDDLCLEDGPNGLAFVHPNPVVESQVRIMNDVMDRRKEVLRRLAE